MHVSCGPPTIQRPMSRASQEQSRPCSRASNRPLASRSGSRVSQSQGQGQTGPCYYHPRNDCCIPCCKPPLPKCPLGTFVERTKPIRPDRLYVSSSAPFNGLTTYKEHYHLKCGPRSLSFKPQSTFDPSMAKMEGLSSYKEAYTPKPLFPYTKPSWAKKAQFDASDAPMQGISTYRNDYNGCRGERVKSLKPLSTFDPSSAAMDGMTTYRHTYIPYCPREYQFAKQPLAKKITGGDISCAPLDGMSTYRADYWPKAIIRTPSMKPNSRAAFSDARFADRTTYKNDYNPFTFEKCFEPCIPAEIYNEKYPPCGIFACGAENEVAAKQEIPDPCPPPCCPPFRQCCPEVQPCPACPCPDQKMTPMCGAGDQNFDTSANCNGGGCQ